MEFAEAVLQQFFLTTDPFGESENTFHSLSLRSKIQIVLRNSVLLVTLLFIYAFVQYIQLMVVDVLQLVVMASAEICYWLLLPFLWTKRVFALENLWVVCSWSLLWVSVYLALGHICHGWTIFGICAAALAFSAIIALGKAVLCLPEFYFNAIYADASSLLDAVRLQKQLAINLWIARLFNLDHILRMQLGIWSMVPRNTFNGSFKVDSALLLGVIALQCLVSLLCVWRYGADSMSFPCVREMAPLCRRQETCTHETCAICLDNLCYCDSKLSAGAPRLRLSALSRRSPGLRLSAAHVQRPLISKLPCGHSFHMACIEGWILDSLQDACPTCRQGLWQTAQHVASDRILAGGLLLLAAVLSLYPATAFWNMMSPPPKVSPIDLRLDDIR